MLTKPPFADTYWPFEPEVMDSNWKLELPRTTGLAVAVAPIVTVASVAVTGTVASVDVSTSVCTMVETVTAANVLVLVTVTVDVGISAVLVEAVIPRHPHALVQLAESRQAGAWCGRVSVFVSRLMTAYMVTSGFGLAKENDVGVTLTVLIVVAVLSTVVVVASSTVVVSVSDSTAVGGEVTPSVVVTILRHD